MIRIMFYKSPPHSVLSTKPVPAGAHVITCAGCLMPLALVTSRDDVHACNWIAGQDAVNWDEYTIATIEADHVGGRAFAAKIIKTIAQAIDNHHCPKGDHAT